MYQVKGAALVTGAARRLGRAMAIALAEDGHDVVVHYVGSERQAQETAQAARDFGVKAVTLQADLLDRKQVAGLVPSAVEAIGGPLGVLVNNASIFEYDTVQTATTTSWDRHMGSNLEAPLFLSQAFANQVKGGQTDEAGEAIASACIINMIDQRVRKLTPEFATYTIAKMGLWAFTQTAAQGLAPDIRVNAIGPGPTLQGDRQTARHFADQRSNIGAMRFILRSHGLTGQLLCMDGGQHLGWKTPDVLGPE
jgi:NAD(P)-dependent dehydrogenase (short-subunit alcohol dehydrogenase family)